VHAALERLQHFAPYAALRATAATLHLFGLRENLRTAATIGSIFARLGPRRMQRAVRHVRWAFPDLSEARAQAIAEASVQHMFQLFLVDSLAGPQRLNEHGWGRHVEFGEVGRTMELLLEDRPAIFVTGHSGNWEFLGLALSLLGFRMSALARPLDNPFLDRWLLGMRRRRGLEVLVKWGATTEVQKVIESGGRVAFIADQNAGDDGVFVPYFGQMASAYKSVALLAMRYRLAIVVGIALRRGEAFDYALHTVDVIRPEDWDAQDDPVFYVTARYNHAMERAIMLDPSQYLWIHRRWRSRPRWERDGKQIPDRTIAQLRALPWIDEAGIERLRADTERRLRGAA